jgi:hydrogenase/urease accessory protein HupE
MKTAMTRLIAFCLISLSASASFAHEMGTTQATATVHADGTFDIDVAVDPDALLSRLLIAAHRPVAPPDLQPGESSRSARDRVIRSLAETFLDAIDVEFDGTRVRPVFDYRPASAFNDMAQAPSVVRLTSSVPARAHDLQFAYGLASGWYALNVRIGESQVRTYWLDGAAPSSPISLAAPPDQTRAQIAWQYFGLGFTHILPKGLDHILFVLGIFLLGTRWRSVFLQVSTFTLAHSITLGLTMYGLVSLPARVVEPMIALSIAYVAIENLITSELKPWRLALVFAFGLLHGMGFAGVLRDLGLPRSQFLTALVTFNGGVEAGQLTVIAIASAAVAYWSTNRPRYRRLVVQPVSLAIAFTGVYWTIQRAFY